MPTDGVEVSERSTAAIVESADPLVLMSVEMCETTRGQFVTAQEAVDLYNVKLKKITLMMGDSGSREKRFQTVTWEEARKRLT